MSDLLRDEVLALRESFVRYATNAGKTVDAASPLLESEVEQFEKRHNIRLPAEYRYFLTLVGNGGEDLFRLGEMDDG